MCNSGAVGRPEVPPGWWRGSWSEPGVLGVRGQETGASAQAESRFVLALPAGWAVPTRPGGGELALSQFTDSNALFSQRRPHRLTRKSCFASPLGTLSS